jgi:hypothetical protein
MTPREWEGPPADIQFDSADYWYSRYNRLADVRALVTYRPEDLQEQDLRCGSDRQFMLQNPKYLKDKLRARNSFEGLLD